MGDDGKALRRRLTKLERLVEAVPQVRKCHIGMSRLSCMGHGCECGVVGRTRVEMLV